MDCGVDAADVYPLAVYTNADVDLQRKDEEKRKKDKKGTGMTNNFVYPLFLFVCAFVCVLSGVLLVI